MLKRGENHLARRSFIPLILLIGSFLLLPGRATTQNIVASTEDQLASRIYTGPHQPDRDGTFDCIVTDIAQNVTTGFLNVAVDLNDDGVIGRYATSDGKVQDEWIIRNVPLSLDPSLSLGRAVSVLFSLNDMDLEGYAVRSCAVQVTDAPLSPGLPTAVESLSSWNRFKIILVGSDRRDADSLGKHLPKTRSVAQAGRADSRPADLAVGADLDIIPDIPQRFNECGPTSTANSLIWMGKKYGFLSRLPHRNDGLLDTAKVITDLMEAMAGTSARPFKGLSGNQMLNGNVRYAQQHGLPYTVEGGSADPAASGAESFQFVAEQKAKGHEVQLLVWRPNGDGHWVTVVGAFREEKRAFLYVHDPDDSKTATAIWEYNVDSTGTITDEFLYPHSCTAAWAVAEVPTTTTLIDVKHSVPSSFQLGDARANIRDASASIDFALPVNAHASLKIIDLKGREVMTLLSSDVRAGVHRAEWKVNTIPSGVYLYRLDARPTGARSRDSFTAFRKLLIVASASARD